MMNHWINFVYQEKFIFIMENKDTQYKTDEKPSEFIEFLFSKKPQDKNSIKLQLDPPEKDKPLKK